MMYLANISSFDLQNDDFVEYIERFENYLLANNIQEAELQKAVFLSTIGGPAYKLLRSLCENDTKNKSFTQLIKLMRDHLKPTPNFIAQRFQFYKRDRKEGESVNGYITELRRLSEHCEFSEKLNDYLRDRFVCGLNNENVQQKLLTIKNLTLETALDTARAYEAAYKDAKILRGTREGHIEQEEVHKMDTRTRFEKNRECFRCGYMEKKEFEGRKEKKLGVKQVEIREGSAKGNTADTDENDSDFLALYSLGEESERVNGPVMVNVKINGKEVGMEVDTGAAVSVMAVSAYRRVKGNKGKLRRSEVVLKTYTGELVRPEGIGLVEVDYKGQCCSLPITVVKGNVPTLMGRDWIYRLNLEWADLCKGIKKVNICNRLDSRVEALVAKFPEVFSDNLGCLKNFKCHIPVREGAQPKFFKPRPVPYALRTRIEQELDRLENQGVWRRVEYSQWAAPIVPVLKNSKDPTGPLRICGDYKITINQAAPLDTYPIPNTTDQLATIAGGQKYTKLDLSQAYQQLELDETSQEFLTINTHQGLYQPTRLQFGVHSATGIFQREMDRRLGRLPFVKVRVDDILISGKSDIEHLNNLESVLRILKESGLTLKASKCSFMQPKVVFCGFIISQEGCRPTTQNVEAVMDAPRPTNIKELRAFLGMANYYNAYLPRMASFTEPLHNLMRKNVFWKWSRDSEEAFQKVKTMLCNAPLLAHFDPSKKIMVHCDASPHGVGAVLSQQQDDGREKPISFASRTLNMAERNYAQVEKEGLALVFAVKKFHQYLYGHKFTLYTDHKPLLGLFSENKELPARAAARVLRWALLLSAYDYKLLYCPGEKNAAADGLSRLPLDASREKSRLKTMEVAMMELVKAPITEKQLRVATYNDPILGVVLNKVLDGGLMMEESKVELKPYTSRFPELSTEGGCLLWGRRVVVPRVLRETVLEELHEVHPGVSKMKALARSYVWWPGIDLEIENKVKNCETCQRNQKCPLTESHPWEYPSRPWERLHIDHAGPMNGKIFLVVVDSFSKWIEVEVVGSTGAKTTIRVLRRLFSTHGLPRVIVSDNGSGFSSEEYKQFLSSNNIKPIYAAPYHPASNGQAERMVQTFKNSLKCFQGSDVETQLCLFLFKYRLTLHSTTGVSPAELLLGRRLRNPLSMLLPEVITKINEKQLPGIFSNKSRFFQPEDPVYVRNYSGGEKWVSAIIVSKVGNVNYKVLTLDGRIQIRHVDQIVKRHVKDCIEPLVKTADGIIGPLLSNKIPETSVPSDSMYDECNPINKDIEPNRAHEQLENKDVSHDGSCEQPEPFSEPITTKTRRSGRTCRKPAYLEQYE
nr:uncharacterized protein K02A2.6-like [Hydra vulgaris]